MMKIYQFVVDNKKSIFGITCYDLLHYFIHKCIFQYFKYLYIYPYILSFCCIYCITVFTVCIIGTISFALLCLQFGRSQLHNLGSTPYTEWMRDRRARRVIAQYPTYDPIILEHFAKFDKFHSHSH